MRVTVEYPVRASGRPKGHSGNKIIIGYLSEEFDLGTNDEPMIKAIELKSQYATVEYLQNGDGHFYKKVNRRSEPVLDGHQFIAQYDSENNPFIETRMKDVRQEFCNKSEADVTKDYFPKELHHRNRYSHSRLINLAEAVIANLELRDKDIARSKTLEAVEQHIVSQGAIYKRVPEPSYGVALSDRKVWIKQWVYSDNTEFARNLLADRATIAFFNLSDIERARDFARELADEVGGVFDGEENLSYATEHYSPMSSYADELTLYRLGKQIEHSVADHMARGTSTNLINKLLDWNSETLGMLRDLMVVLNKPDWMKESPALERIVGNCIEYDRANRSQVFTKPPLNTDSFDFELAYSQWQMREFSAPSMRR